jgi:hypothetical protein
MNESEGDSTPSNPDSGESFRQVDTSDSIEQRVFRKDKKSKSLLCDVVYYGLLITASIIVLILNNQYCESYSFNLCFEEYLIGGLTVNLPLTMVAAGIFIGLIIRGGKDKKPYKRLIITCVTLTALVLSNRRITKHNFGGIFTNIMTVLILLTLALYYGCRACCKHRKMMPWKTLLVLMIVLIFYARYRYTYMVEHSCDRWTQGLSMDLDQSDQYCHIEEPKVCHAEMLHRVLDLSLYFDTVNCENQETAK